MTLLQIDYTFQNGSKVYWKGSHYMLIKDDNLSLGYGVKNVYNDYYTPLTENDLIDCVILEDY